MHRNDSTVLGLVTVLGLTLGLLPSPAQASFHFMQIEQVVGGVCGDATLQAVQLRQRSNGQNLVGGARLVAYDALGLNPVEIIQFPSNVANGGQGDRILVVSSGLAGAISEDFTMTHLIPESYLASGRLTFESSGGTIYWSIAWGGPAYKGPTTGAMSNDSDGDFGPPVDDALPSLEDKALQFQGDAGDLSTSNDADYLVTPTGATLTDNSGTSSEVEGTCSIFGDGFESADTSEWSTTVGGS